MKIELVKVTPHDITEYKRQMQLAFQKGFEKKYGKTDSIILPEKDIARSMNTKGAVAYKAVLGEEIVGGAVVVIDEKTQCNHLDLLYVKDGIQSKGIGTQIWFALEKLYPNTKVWETITPYFEKRNIHFYVNICGFHIVEFFNKKHPMPNMPEDFMGDGKEGSFAFQKQMQPSFK